MITLLWWQFLIAWMVISWGFWFVLMVIIAVVVKRKGGHISGGQGTNC